MFPIFVCSQMLRENQTAQTTNDYEVLLHPAEPYRTKCHETDVVLMAACFC